VLLVLTGIVAGVAGSVAGVASIVSFPMLLALGLSPIEANVTNTAANGFVGFGALAGSRVELAGLGRAAARLAILTSVGAAVGAALLLVAPADSFAAVAPWLVAASSVVILAQPWWSWRSAVRGADRTPRGPRFTPGRLALLAGVSVYTGYFGAASGVLVLLVLTTVLTEPLARVNAVKNVVQGMANLVAATGFAAFGPVHWAFVAPLAIGYLGGGWLGPAVVRRLPGQSLRWLVGCAGLLVAVYLALRS
jgi:uncharacterized membrane protein YfcA